jgi:hypothetical protein
MTEDMPNHALERAPLRRAVQGRRWEDINKKSLPSKASKLTVSL